MIEENNYGSEYETAILENNDLFKVENQSYERSKQTFNF